MFKKAVAVAAIGFTALALSSCSNSGSGPTPSASPSSVEPRVVLGDAEPWDSSNVPSNSDEFFEVNVLRIADLHSGEVVLGGSSSCPPVPAEATYEDGLLEIQLSKEDSDRICTMDLRQYGISVELQGGEWDLQTEAQLVSGDEITELKVVWPEEDSDEDTESTEGTP